MSIAGMLPAFRKALKPLLVKTCTPYPAVKTADGHSGWLYSWPTAGATFSCDCQATGSGSAGEFSYSGDADAYAVLCDESILLRNGDRIAVDGMTLEVLSNTPDPAINALRRYDCARTTGGTT